MPFSFLAFTLKIVAKNCFVIKNILLKLQIALQTRVFDNYKADIYWNKISRKKDRSPC